MTIFFTLRFPYGRKHGDHGGHGETEELSDGMTSQIQNKADIALSQCPPWSPCFRP
jgi:hypothetical protein